MNIILKIETTSGHCVREEKFKLEDNMKNIVALQSKAVDFVSDSYNRSQEMEESMYFDSCYVTLGVEGDTYQQARNILDLINATQISVA